MTKNSVHFSLGCALYDAQRVEFEHIRGVNSSSDGSDWGGVGSRRCRSCLSGEAKSYEGIIETSFVLIAANIVILQTEGFKRVALSSCQCTSREGGA